MRRQFILAVGALLSAPRHPFAQPAQKVRRIGVLSADAPASPTGQQQQQRFRESLRRFGYQEGRNLAMEWRFAEGNVGRLSTHAEELVRLKVELITTVSSNSATTAAKRATRTIPIVMHLAEAPVEQGLIESLARPSGNVTGTTGIGPEAVGKVIQILKEAQPNTARVAVLRGGTGPGDLYSVSRERAAGAFGITFQYFDVTRPEEVSVALYRIASSNPDALYVTGGPVLRARFGDIVAFALERKLITFTNSFSFVNAGGFLAYVTDLPDMWDLTARYVDSILKGARPADLPVEQPRKFLLIVNAKTARAIGFKIPQSLLLRADRVIE